MALVVLSCSCSLVNLFSDTLAVGGRGPDYAIFATMVRSAVRVDHVSTLGSSTVGDTDGNRLTQRSCEQRPQPQGVRTDTDTVYLRMGYLLREMPWSLPVVPSTLREGFFAKSDSAETALELRFKKESFSQTDSSCRLSEKSVANNTGSEGCWCINILLLFLAALDADFGRIQSGLSYVRGDESWDPPSRPHDLAVFSTD